jgi:hypothetical protein
MFLTCECCDRGLRDGSHLWSESLLLLLDLRGLRSGSLMFTGPFAFSSCSNQSWR